MQNQGFDMSLEFDKQINKDLYISARGNFTYNRTRKPLRRRTEPDLALPEPRRLCQQPAVRSDCRGLFASEEDIANWPKQDFGPRG